MTDPTPVPPPMPPAQPVYAAPAGSRPGFGLGVAGLIVDFFVPIVGLILSIVGKVQSNRAGVKNAPATVGIVLGIVFTIVAIIIGVVVGIGVGALAAKCADLGPGTHTVSGVTYTCPTT